MPAMSRKPSGQQVAVHRVAVQERIVERLPMLPSRQRALCSAVVIDGTVRVLRPASLAPLVQRLPLGDQFLTLDLWRLALVACRLSLVV